MRRRIDEYIRENRQKFYELEPPLAAWELLAQKLPVERPNSKPLASYNWLKIAALLLLVCTLGMAYWQYLKSSERTGATAMVFPEQKQYLTEIEQRRGQLGQIRESEPVLYKDFIADINELQKNYLELRRQLQKSPNRGAIIEAMRKNLEAQMSALNQQLDYIRTNTNSRRYEVQAI